MLVSSVQQRDSYTYIHARFSRFWLFVASWTVAHQASLSFTIYLLIYALRGDSAYQKELDTMSVTYVSDMDSATIDYLK